MKKKGFTLIETLTALAIFMMTITFFYQYSANSVKEKVKSVNHSNLDKLSVSILDILKIQKYQSFCQNDKLDKISEIKLMDNLENLNKRFSGLKDVVNNLTLKGIDKNKIILKLDLTNARVEYQGGENNEDNDYHPPEDKNLNKNNSDNDSKLVYKHWKENGTDKINPFESKRDEMIKGVLVIAYPKNNKILRITDPLDEKVLKISRSFYIFK